MPDMRWFEYCPPWIKVGVRCVCFFQDHWYSGIITSTHRENDRGIEIATDEEVVPGRKILSIPVFMSVRSKAGWRRLITRELKANHP
jgi:hypothetical protein